MSTPLFKLLINKPYLNPRSDAVRNACPATVTELFNTVLIVLALDISVRNHI